MINIEKKNIVYIVILNWNGYEDTINCLKSLYQCLYSNFHIILLDNKSQNNSVSVLKNWIIANAEGESCDENGGNYIVTMQGSKITFIENNDNFGFAKGNNIGINYALKLGAEYVMLLNNDTETNTDFLDILMDVYEQRPQLAAVIPQIRYFFDQNLIWNCGGKLFFGFRKYLFNDKPFSKVPTHAQIPITYATGCALLFKPAITGILSEKFFFGEEDFEFGYRMKHLKKKMICVTDSVIYHKVGQSVKNAQDKQNKGIIFIFYLNRFINMKEQFGNKILWNFWRLLYLPYIILTLKSRFGFSEFYNYLKLLYRKSSTMTEVNKTDFEFYRNLFK